MNPTANAVSPNPQPTSNPWPAFWQEVARLRALMLERRALAAACLNADTAVAPEPQADAREGGAT